MKISIKITDLEITIEHDDAPQLLGMLLPVLAMPDLAAGAGEVAALRSGGTSANGTPTEAPATAADKRSDLIEPVATVAAATAPIEAPAPRSRARPVTAAALMVDSSKRRLGFDEFDRLLRSEMKRLAPTPGTMPSYKIWDEQRTDRLPTMQRVCRRYDCKTYAELATKLGLEPPLGKRRPEAEPETAEATA